MDRLRRVSALGVVVCLAALAVGGCGGLGVLPTNIASIQADPRAYDGRLVAVSGVVTGSANLLWFRHFTVRDGTGEICVRTDRAVPQAGRKVFVRGRVRQVLAVGQLSLLVLDEDPLW
jgi:hypothetical protein